MALASNGALGPEVASSREGLYFVDLVLEVEDPRKIRAMGWSSCK